MRIGGRVFEGYTFVMAIINLTPDSFYAPSRKGLDEALFAVERAQADGAAIIDLGAQSTRPGYSEVGCEEELKRLIKPLEAIKARFELPVSVDTYFSRCAREALSAGADMINDIRGFRSDKDMAAVVAEFGAAACLMHGPAAPVGANMWEEIERSLKESVKIALDNGVEADKLILDGGIGFGKTREQNFELLNSYERLKKLGYPLLLGASRKSMFGGAVEDRLPQTLQSTRLSCEKGVLFVRVHDVKENFEIIKKTYESMA